MITRIARAGLAAVAFASLAGSALAADLDYSAKDAGVEPYAPYYYHRDTPRQGQYYEEKRYEQRRYIEPAPVDRHAPPPRYSYHDDRGSPRDWSRYDQRGCLSKGEIRYRLKEHGWNDFQDVEIRSDTAVVSARRPDGMTYRIEVDRCSGVIVQARLLDDGRGWRQGARPPYERTY